MTQTEKGIFTQTPDVLLMTCDLPDETIMLFNRLYCLSKFKGGIFYGSIRKLAIAVNVKRDKAHRNLKALTESGLADTGASSELDVSAIKLNIDDLWELNIAYKAGVEIPRWTNLQKALEGVRKIGQSTTEEQPETEANLEENVVRKIGQDDRNLGQSNAKIGQDDRNLGHFVRRSELNVPPKNNKNNKNKEDNKTDKGADKSATPTDQPALPPSSSGKKRGRPTKQEQPKQIELPIALSPGGQAVWDNWCTMPWFKIPPKLTDKAAEHCENLAKYNPTRESMLAAKNWATSSAVDRKGWYKNKAWSLYWLLQEYPKWLSTAPNQVSQTEQKQPTPINPDKLVWWTRFSDHEGDPESHWYLYERMPLSEAMKDPIYELMSLPPAVAVNIATRYGQLERGEIPLPRNIPEDAPANHVKCIA